MSVYVEVNSSRREKVTYPNPFDFAIGEWCSGRWHPVKGTNKMAGSVRVSTLILPWKDVKYTDASGVQRTSHTGSMGRLYLSINTGDTHPGLIHGAPPGTHFVLLKEGEVTDKDATPVASKFYCDMSQDMLLSPEKELRIKVLQDGGRLLSTDKDDEVYLVIEVFPLLSEADVENPLGRKAGP